MPSFKLYPSESTLAKSAPTDPWHKLESIMTQTALQPVNLSTISDTEKENEAPWVVRKLVGWGDSSPLLLPCIRFRDLVVHTVIAATGGTAAVAAPVMGPIADTAVATFGDTIVIELGNVVAYDLGTKLANDLIADKTSKAIIPIHSARLETASVKTILITLRFKHTVSDAALGFFRSGTVHQDGDLFTNIKDYLSVDKGWFSPYLFASSRRPIIPRSMKPDIIFCHGPFLSGDYHIAETLLAESASVIKLCLDPTIPAPKSPMLKVSERVSELGSRMSAYWHRSPSPTGLADSKANFPGPSSDDATTQSDSADHSHEASTANFTTFIPTSRRILVVVIGLSPHRKLWTSSARPGESVMNYHLLNGCPALVLPAVSVKGSTPLVAWDTLTLGHLHTIGKESGGVDGEALRGVVTCLFEYLSLCVDWDRIIIPGEVTNHSDGADSVTTDEEFKKKLVWDGVELVLAGAVRSHDSKAVKTGVDADRAGIVMFRMS